MKIGFYNPYFDAFGGGERYILTLASHWGKKHDVSIFWDDPGLLHQSEKRFAIDLGRVKTTGNIFKSRTVIDKLRVSSTYDLIFVLSDGSIPLSAARRNILHFQVPFSRVSMPFFKKPIYQAVICNSQFTRNNLNVAVASGSFVIYPPVDTKRFSASEKEKTILSVGRFNSHHHSKKQDVLIGAFIKAVHRKLLEGYNLVLAGSLHFGDQEYFGDLKKSAAGYPVRFLPNISFDMLRSLYAEASVYWHAAGYGETDPAYMEHFGITTVEAMASGAIPVVYDAGGQREIITEGTGYLWKDTDTLIDNTRMIVSDPDLGTEIRRKAAIRTVDFDTSIFLDAYDSLLDKLFL